MPKTAKPKTYRDACPEAAAIKGNILLLMETGGYSRAEIAKGINMPISTFNNRMRAPWTFTLAEQSLLTKFFGLRAGQLVTIPKHEVEPLFIRKERDDAVC